MKYTNLVIILVALGFLFSCVSAPTSLVSYDEYEEILKYNESISNEDFIEADEPYVPSFETEEANDPFRTAATVAVNDCFKASAVGAAGDEFILQNSVIFAGTGDCVILDLHDIIFDCDGYTILGNPGVSDDGIYVNNKFNVTIQNCTIEDFANTNDTGGGVYDFSYGIVVGRAAGNVTILNTVISGIDPPNPPGITGAGGGGVRFNSQWSCFPAYLNITNLTVVTSNNGVRIGSQTLACPGPVPGFIQGPFWTRDSNFSGNTYFQYVAYNTEGNHIIDNTVFRAGEDRSVQITGNRSLFATNGHMIENISITNCTFFEGFNRSDIFIERAYNVSIVNNSIYKNIFITNATNISIVNNTFTENDTANRSYNSIYVNIIENLTILKNLNVPEMFDLNDLTRAFIRHNTFTNNGLIRIQESVAGTNANVVIENNNFSDMSIQGQTAGGISYSGGNANISFNNFLRGIMYSIEIVGAGNRIVGNQINDTRGIVFKVKGDTNQFINNSVYNHTGTVFWINGTSNIFFRNDLVFILKYVNTSLNYDAKGPFSQVPEGSIGFLLLRNINTNITRNTIGILNPLALINGVFGIKTANTTKGVLANLAVLTQNILIVNNTFGLASVSDFGPKTAIDLTSSFNGIIENNTVRNCEHEGIVINAGQDNNLTTNNITQLNWNRVPYYAENAVKIFRSFNNRLTNNTIINYDTGIFCYNSTFDTFKNNDINFSSRQGIFSFQCLNTTLSSNVIFNATSGIKLFFSNLTSLIRNTVNQTKIGFDFNYAFNNTASNNIQENSTIGLNLDLFSGNNTFNNNDFTKNTDVDVLYDMFAKTNTGAGNNYATSRSENYASGNLI